MNWLNMGLGWDGWRMAEHIIYSQRKQIKGKKIINEEKKHQKRMNVSIKTDPV